MLTLAKLITNSFLQDLDRIWALRLHYCILFVHPFELFALFFELIAQKFRFEHLKR